MAKAGCDVVAFDATQNCMQDWMQGVALYPCGVSNSKTSQESHHRRLTLPEIIRGLRHDDGRTRTE
eukprot:1955821-Rhodomonas_salina.1